MRKKLDQKIQQLIQGGINLNNRSIFVLIGDRSRYQVVNLFQLLSKMTNNPKPSILWCYKKDLGFTTHKKKREVEIKNQQMQEDDLNEPFNLFLSTNQIRYCYYAETQKILGNTYNMLILSDFEALTPNILCRTIETVEGGGIIIFLLKTMSSLQQLYRITMDVHSRLKTQQFKQIVPRFNERFILSLSKCQRCLFLDDELNLLKVSSAIEQATQDSNAPKNNQQLKITELADSIPSSNEIAQKLVRNCKTLDQAKVIMSMIDVLQEKVFRYTMTVQAARGRGKSAAIGMAAAGAIKLGFSNIFITAPSPENLNTFFEFLIQSLELLDFKQNQHFEIIQSTNPEFNKAIIRVNVFKSHRQFVQYILPQDFHKVQTNADLVFCDEAAAIPLQFVKDMFGPYNLILSSTINGYEGTGRSLSLKLIQKLREQNKTGGSRLLKEVSMNDPIRYGNNDVIEKWLYDLLLLDATEAVKLQRGLPHPNECELYLVNRDTMFSYQKTSEKFLFNLMSLFISSHYKNSPNDLQLLSDAPAHVVFVLLGPMTGEKSMPDILCAIQVCFEGSIPLQLVDEMSNQQKPSGDLIPWTLSKYYLDNHFPQYSGARIIRIATHPSAQKMGYGSRALELLTKFCKSEIVDPSVEQQVHIDFREYLEDNKDNNNNNNETKAKKLPPLLKKLTEIYPPQLDYLGVSFGLTQELYKFWNKNDFQPSYLSLRKNDVTGEYTTIVLKALMNDQPIQNITKAFSQDFRNRFLELLSYNFNELDPYMCIDILKANIIQNNTTEDDIEINKEELISKQDLLHYLTFSDYQRLDNYCRSMSDFYLILDILPNICRLFFQQKCGKSVRMSRTQAALLLSMGLQHRTIEDCSSTLNLTVNQTLPLFNKAMRKMRNVFKMVLEGDIVPTKKQRNEEKVESKIVQKRGNVNYEIENFGEDEVVMGLKDGKDVVTLGRDKEKRQLDRKKIKK